MGKNFGWPVTVFLYEDYLRLLQCIQNNKPVFDEKELVVFGAGIRGSVFCRLLHDMGYKDFTFVDNNTEKWGGYVTHAQHSIHAPETLLHNSENKVVLVSIENIESVFSQLLSYGYKENENLFFVMTNIYHDYIKEMQRPYSGNTLLMGDCGFSQISITDTNQKSLGAMLKEEIGEEHIKVLGMHGMGMRSFYHIIKQLIVLGQIPKKLLLMTNFEVFTKMHHLLPRTQHAQLFSEMACSFETVDKELYEYVQITQSRSSQIYGEAIQYSEENVDNNARLFIKMNYMYKFSNKTEDAEYFVKIMQVCKEKGIKLIPFIPPVNYEFAEQCYSEFRTKYDANFLALTSLITKYGFDYLDTSYCVKACQFADLKTIDETCNYQGRLIIFEKIADKLKNSTR